LQKFHNERAIHQAEHLGLDVENIQTDNQSPAVEFNVNLVTAFGAIKGHTKSMESTLIVKMVVRKVNGLLK